MAVKAGEYRRVNGKLVKAKPASYIWSEWGAPSKPKPKKKVEGDVKLGPKSGKIKRVPTKKPRKKLTQKEKDQRTKDQMTKT